MLRMLALLLVLAGGSVAAADQIRPIVSWDDYFKDYADDGLVVIGVFYPQGGAR